MPTLEMVSLIHSFRSFPTEWQRREINKKTKEDDWGGEIEESARLIAQQAAGSQSILWEWVNKQRVINAFIQRGEMFCMAWFMELSRLSNSLGSVCSQRRGRLAAGAGRPRLPHFLSHRSPPIPPPCPQSQERFLSHCANGRTPPADPRGFCAPLSRTSLYAPTLARSSLGCHSQPWSTNTMALCQREFGFQPLLAASHHRRPNPPTWGVRLPSAWSPVRAPITLPAVQFDILQSIWTWQGPAEWSRQLFKQKNLTANVTKLKH